jgi:7-cyano-7-deazaguanine synthase in queuosine biosynthesis
VNYVTPMQLPKIDVVVTEEAIERPYGYNCVIGEHIKFNEEKLLSYCFARWEPVVFDLLVVAAAVEFCDRLRARPVFGWSREIHLEVPVYEVRRWEEDAISNSLTSALNFLTGDKWSIVFVERVSKEFPYGQGYLEMPTDAHAVVPFSDGMDSRAVAGLATVEHGERVIRVRLGSKTYDKPVKGNKPQPFTNVPYKVKSGQRRFSESSNRSRGFKFSAIAAVAAYLAGVDTVIVPESGQGALAPALIPVVQAYPDFRNHPRFLRMMEKFIGALLNHNVRYAFPRLWSTKGETLREFVSKSEERDSWLSTISCWQQNRHVPVDGKKRQCGICAACMLRRMSVHAAGLTEPAQNYVWEDLSASSFQDAVPKSFSKITPALREYAIGGTMHMDHLAALFGSANSNSTLSRNASELARALGVNRNIAESKLLSLLHRHHGEWHSFLDSLGSKSFIRQWVVSTR